MIEVDCSEMSADEQLALAGALTEALRGSVVALVKCRRIVLDNMSDNPIDEVAVLRSMAQFIARRKNADLYSLERKGNTVIVHSADPIAAKHRDRVNGLPPNLYQCPFCPFVTPYEEAYVVHYRAHGV